MSIIKRFNQQDFVYKDVSIKMNKNQMSKLLFAIIMTNAQIITTFGIGIYECTPKQNIYNLVSIKIFIHPNDITYFEELSGTKLRDPIKIQIN